MRTGTQGLITATLPGAIAMPGMASDKSIVTVLTAVEPQTQLMAMVLTFQSIRQGSSAHILLCGPAADMALENAPASATTGQKPRNMSPQGLMKMIMEKSPPRLKPAPSTCPMQEWLPMP